MSNEARNYVKSLDNSRVRPPEKSLLFFLADYHHHEKRIAWPSLRTLAEDSGLDLRYVRRLVARCVELGIISYDPGLGRGNKGHFRFLELDPDTARSERGRDGGQKRGQKGERKGGQKEGLHDSTIRNEPEPEPGTQDHHRCAALRVWLALKEWLRNELSSEEWNLWVRPTRLLKVMDQRFLLLAMPPSSAIIRAASERKQMLRAKLAEHGYFFGFTKYPDDSERDRLRELGWAFGADGSSQVGKAA